MADQSKIEWTDGTLNLVTGCEKASSGCANCYAERMTARLKAMGQAKYAAGFDVVKTHPAVLSEPLRWRKPRKVFVCSMGDLFHHRVPFEFISAAFGVMAASPQHTFQILTKRPRRMLEFFRWVDGHEGGARLEVCWRALKEETGRVGDDGPLHTKHAADPEGPWPLPNVWLGVSAENQPTWDWRVDALAKCPAAVRFVSMEPMLGPIDPCLFYYRKHIDWIIAGGESGPGSRPMDVAWVEAIVLQGKEAGVPVFVKQLGAKPFDSREGFKYSDPHPDGPAADPDCRLNLKSAKGKDPEEWPESLRVKEWPR